jgi:hypothetical protein
MISRQTGWTDKERLLYEIGNKFKYANKLAYKWTQGNFNQSANGIGYMIIDLTFKIS